MTYSDGSFATPALFGPPEISYPMPEYDPAHYILRQPTICLASAYAGPTLSATHPNYPAAYCVADENSRTLGPMLTFERVYATVPAARELEDTEVISFPAFPAAADDFSLLVKGERAYLVYNDVYPRQSAISLPVPVRRQVEYFIPGLVGGYATLEEVPLWPPFAFTATTVDGLDAGNAGVATLPDIDTYKIWVKTQVEIVGVGTQITRYLGAIYRAETVWTRAR